MVGIYIGIALLAVVTVGLFVDNLRSEDVDKKASVAKEVGYSKRILGGI